MTQYVYINENREASYNPKDGYTAQCEVNLWNTVYSRPENYERWKIVDGDFYVLTDEEYALIQQAKEQERIASLNLTGADVERAIYKAFGKDFTDVRNELVLANIPGLDLKALDIELKANNFFRGNPYLNAVGQFLGISEKQLDRFFETNNFEELIREEIV